MKHSVVFCIFRLVWLSLQTIFRIFFQAQKETLLPVAVTISSQPFPGHWLPWIYLLSLWICLFCIFHGNGITHVGFFHLVYFQGSSMFWHISFYCQITFPSMNKLHFIYPFSNLRIWVISTFWVLGIMLLGLLVYKFLCEHMFSVLLGIYLGVELLDQMVTLFLSFWGMAELYFPKGLHHFTLQLAMYEGSNFSTSLATLVITCLTNLSYLVGMQWYHIVLPFSE